VAVDGTPAAQFGPIDIYLFDQVLRGRIAPGDRIVDAGCGMGRNLARSAAAATACPTAPTATWSTSRC
jgi:hypothetical protein